MKLNLKEGRKLAAARTRVANIKSRKVGNLVDWLNGQYCRVFTHYDQVGACKLPVFDLWPKSDTYLETDLDYLLAMNGLADEMISSRSNSTK